MVIKYIVGTKNRLLLHLVYFKLWKTVVIKLLPSTKVLQGNTLNFSGKSSALENN